MGEYMLQASQTALCTADKWLTSADLSPTGTYPLTDFSLYCMQTDG